MRHIGTAGPQGGRERSDCRVEIELADSGGIQISLESKVERLFGPAIRALAKAIFSACGQEHLRCNIQDLGALDFALAARIEAALAAATGQTSSWLPERKTRMPPATRRDRQRRTRLYLPGNRPNFFTNAALHKPDAIILDLEDSVAPQVKDEARIMVRNALRVVDFKASERMVRINQLPMGLEDIDAVLPHGVDVIMLPKCEYAQQVVDVASRVEAVRQEHDLQRPTYVLPIIESARGVLNALAIAESSDLVVAMALGIEDYTADIGATRSLGGDEAVFARGMVLNAARAAGIQPLESVFSDVRDTAGLQATAARAKALGFVGMGCIHPRQVGPIHAAFAPSPEELEFAQRVVTAYEEATAKGLGAVALGSKMIDPPVVSRALQVTEAAEAAGLLDPDWRETK